MKEHRQIVRAADRIHESLTRLRTKKHHELVNRLGAFTDKLRELTGQAKKIDVALSRNWQAAAERCSKRVNRILDELSYSLARVRELAERPAKDVPALSVLVQELQELEREFGSIQIDDTEEGLSVETDPITLEEVHLGSFRILLALNKLQELYTGNPYWCIALDPNPPATTDDVTHPHVSNERLCEGDGAAAIRTALEEGRLCDFFTLVRSILNTYNPDSPYVSISEWDGISCYDCGYVMDRDDIYCCGFCGHDYCEQCSSYCRVCDETVCLGCGGQCPHCEELVCPNCISKCAECDSQCCKGCLEEGLCPTCKEESEANNEEPERDDRENGSKARSETIREEAGAETAASTSSLQGPGAEVHANGMGQAAPLP